jgi:hypothetical protein
MGVGRKSGAVVLPPHSCRTLKLMSCILSLQHFSHPQDTELIFHSVNPFFCIQGFCGFLEDRWTGIHEILETAVLVCFVSTKVYPSTGVICDTAQRSFHILLHALHVALASKKLCEKLLRSVGWRRRWWITVIITSCAATSLSGTIHGTMSVRHLHVSATIIIR